MTAVGQYWTRGRDQVEIDAVILAGMPEIAVAVGECKWSDSIDGSAVRAKLARSARVLPRTAEDLTYIVCARAGVYDATGTVPIVAADIFG